LLIINPKLLFSVLPGCPAAQMAQMAQKQKSRITKSPLMQDWVFRLGPEMKNVELTKTEQFAKLQFLKNN
jgi:hypothetical protein